MPDGFDPYIRRDHSMTSEIALALETISASKRAAEAKIREAESEAIVEEIQIEINKVKATQVLLGTMAVWFQNHLGNLGKKRLAKQQFLRSLHWKWNDYRPVSCPDPLDTILLAVAFVCVEGAMAGSMMISGGQVGFIEGLAYGASFAALNVAVGIVAGLVLRATFYKRNAKLESPFDRKVRRWGRIGFSACTGLLALLIFVAARTRAAGGHEGVFNFQDVSFLATFADGNGVQIIALGIVSSLLAVWKGATGLMDVRIGFSKALHEAVDAIDGQAARMANNEMLAVEQRVSEEEKRLKKLLPRLDKTCRDLEQLEVDAREAVGSHNDLLVREKAHLKASWIDRLQGAAFMSDGVHFDGEEPDLSAIDRLKLPDVEDHAFPSGSTARANLAALRTEIGSLSAAANDALAEIATAHTEFIGDAPDITFTATT
jgi:hypothetical protein